MPNKAHYESVSLYLQELAESPVGKHPEPSNELVQKMRENPKEYFRVLIEFLNEKRPDKIDPRDIDIPIGKLLPHIAEQVAESMIEQIHKKHALYRSMFIYSAAESEAKVFVPELLALLGDRSNYIKKCVLDVISRWPHLQIPEAIPLVDKVSKQ